MDNREQLKSVIAQAEAIRTSAAAKGSWSKEDSDAFTAKLGEIDRIKVQIEAEEKLAGYKSWADAPDGQSVVRNSFDGRTAGPGEGDIPGVTADPNSKELYGYDKLGEQKLAALKSGAYKDAMNEYLRLKALNGDSWQSGMKASHMKVLMEGQDTAGGFFVPVEQRADLVKKMAGVTGVKNDVFRFTVGTDLVSFPKIVYTSNPSDDSTSSIFTSGLRFSNGTENPAADISEATNPVAGKILIPIHLQTAAIVITRQLMEDSMFDVLGYCTALGGETLALQEDYWFINGTGAGQPQGILSHANSTVAYSSGGMQVKSGGAGSLLWGNSTSGLIGIEALLPPQYDANAKWYAAKGTYAAARAINVSTYGVQWGFGESYPNAANGYSPSLLGHPIVKDQFVPALASSAYCMLFGDISGYFAPERVGISVEVFREVKGLRDEVVIYMRRRLGGQLVHDWKVKNLIAST